MRGKGFGGRLLFEAEQEAMRRGCRGVYTDTFSFQVLPFYQQNGYEVFGEIENYPPGHTCYFLKKCFMTVD
jgi:GNAT superfamily N-acetyltransferase